MVRGKVRLFRIGPSWTERHRRIGRVRTTRRMVVVQIAQASAKSPACPSSQRAERTAVQTEGAVDRLTSDLTPITTMCQQSVVVNGNLERRSYVPEDIGQSTGKRRIRRDYSVRQTVAVSRRLESAILLVAPRGTFIHTH